MGRGPTWEAERRACAPCLLSHILPGPEVVTDDDWIMELEGWCLNHSRLMKIKIYNHKDSMARHFLVHISAFKLNHSPDF